MTATCRTERMHLRPLAPEDRDEYLRVHEVSVGHFGPWFPEGSPEELFQRELEKIEEGTRRGTQARWAGVLADGRMAGFFNLNEIVRGVFQSAYASWAVSAELAGQGLGTEGVQALLDLAFSPEGGLGLHRVQANIIPGNLASVRIAQKLRMRREGLAERYLRIAGRWQDHLMYAKTVEEHRFVYLPGPDDAARDR